MYSSIFLRKIKKVIIFSEWGKSRNIVQLKKQIDIDVTSKARKDDFNMSKDLELITKEDNENKVVEFDYKLVDEKTAECMKSATEKIAMLREKTQ